MQWNQDLRCLDDLIGRLGGGNDPGRHSKGSCELLLEHLATARRYLLGSMRREYASSLKQAKSSIACISAKAVKDLAKQTLEYLIAAERA